MSRLFPEVWEKIPEVQNFSPERRSCPPRVCARRPAAKPRSPCVRRMGAIASCGGMVSLRSEFPGGGEGGDGRFLCIGAGKRQAALDKTGDSRY